VNAIGPGAILFPEDYTQEQREVVISKTLLKRGGAPEDVATALEFFCRCDFVTGVFLPVDGGQSVPRI
jgi:NAD(P)-dependent dehydrogenase (short-subunit alcohol dehydrogenase family)